MEQPTVLEFNRTLETTAPVSLRGYDAKGVSNQTSISTGIESKVQQQFAEEVDVNTIMRRFGISGVEPLGVASGVYGDFTDIHDYESALERVRGAQERFMELPADVRERFNNDPGLLIRRATEMEPKDFDSLFAGGTPDVVVPEVVPPV